MLDWAWAALAFAGAFGVLAAAGDRQRREGAAEAALAAVRANPFAFLDGDARALEARLGRAPAGSA